MRYMVVACMLALLGMLGCVKQDASSAAPSVQGERKAGDMMTVDIGSGVMMDFCWCPPGSFMMGSPDSKAVRSANESPQHTVTFKQGFWMGKYEVTQGQWKAVMGNTPSHFKGGWFRRNMNLPVEQVSWDDCQDFLEKLNEKGGGTFRLPSEAEWEYACRAGTRTPFAFGVTLSTDQANYYDAAAYSGWRGYIFHPATTAVGSFPANAWNLCDMHGNVWEWCQDVYLDDYIDAPTDGSAWESPAGQFRVLRGGGYDYSAVNCRSADRYNNAPDYLTYRTYDYGLRVVRTP